MSRTPTTAHPPALTRLTRLVGCLVAVCALALVTAGAADAAKCTKKGKRGVDVLKGTKKRDVLCGKGGDDLIIGKGGNDVLKGGGGNDALTGKAGDDSLSGGPGDDTLTGGSGNDKLKGQDGTDMAGLADSASGVVVDLAAGTATGDGDDTLLTVENVTGSAFDDVLHGDAGANGLSGGDGNDALVGMAGDDTLAGQGGVDSTTYAPIANPVNADLRTGTVTGDGTDTISGIENLTGSAHDDTIVSDGADNLLDGGAGLDTVSFAGAPAGVDADLGASGATGDGTDTLVGFEDLTGSGNADRLAGDAAGNRIDGAGGDDTLIGAGGDDQLAGGTGADTASYAGSAAPIEANLRAASVTGAGHDTLAAVENVTGSDHGDTLAGDAGANVLDGAGGLDTVSFAGSPQGVNADLATGLANGDGADTITGFENAIGSAHDDSIIGTPDDNALAGGAGDDNLTAGDGNDHVVGEDGQDSLFGEANDDDLSGGAGDDHLDGGDGANDCDGGTGNNTFAGNCDAGAPVITAMSITPSSVDTSGAARDVDFSVHLTDDAAGVDPGATSVTVHSPDGSPTFTDGLELATGDALDGTYDASITLPRYSKQGTWTVEVEVADNSGNHDLWTTAELATAGLPHDFDQTGAGDTHGPTLVSFDASPDSIDTSAADADVTFDLTATDDLAGVDPAASHVTVQAPGGGQTFQSALDLVSGTSLNGDYQATITIPRYAPHGTWKIELLLVDAAANETRRTSAQLGADGTFTQIGTGDSDLPTLTAFDRTPGQINTSGGDQTVDMTLSAGDSLSGIDPAASKVIFTDSVGQPGGESSLTLASGTSHNGDYTASITVPRGSASGTWKISVELVDSAGNVELLTSADLIAAGYPGTFENVPPDST